MMWGPKCILILSALCSALAEEAIDDGEPSLHVMARPSVFNAGERRAIFCQGKNLPDEINWYSPSGEVVGERSSLNTRRYVERKTDAKGVLVPLIFHELKIADTGSWVCKAGEFNETIDIIVGIKVKIPKRTEEKEGDEGRSIRLECEAQGHPSPVVQWYRHQRPINVAGSNKYAIKKKNDLYSLEIKNLSYEDVGDYVCKVTQKALSHYIDKTISLSVRHAPVLNTAETVETYGILNEIKNLSCAAHALPPPTYQWFRRTDNFDSEISEDDTVFTAEDGSESILSLKLRKEDDLGQYKCKISNSKGSKSVIFDVSRGNKPPPPDFVAHLSSNVSALSFNVSCSACNLQPDEEGIAARPDNLPVIGYQFQLTPVAEGYPPNWDVAFESLVYITEDDSYSVGGLPNTTEFHVRVRSLNDAGYSDWFDFTEHPSTTSQAVRLLATMVVVLATFLAVAY